VSELTTEFRQLADDAARQARPPAAADIIRQGDRRRRRSLTHQSLGALSAAGVAGTGVALGLGLTAGATPAPAAHGTSTGTGTGTIQTAAFTLVKHANGTATLTLSNNTLFEPATLQSDLAQDGIPAKVTSGSFCSTDPIPAGIAQVITVPAAQPDSGPVVQINPAAMPAGTELSFGEFKLANSGRAVIGLINPNSYTCSSTPPVGAPGLAVFGYKLSPSH
jgi:hypothetical protein